MKTGEKIRAIRKEKGLTQKKLGEISSTSENTIRQYELGLRQPRIEQLQKIAVALDVEISSLLELSNDLDKRDIRKITNELIRAYDTVGTRYYEYVKHRKRVESKEVDRINNVLSAFNYEITLYSDGTYGLYDGKNDDFYSDVSKENVKELVKNLSTFTEYAINKFIERYRATDDEED